MKVVVASEARFGIDPYGNYTAYGTIDNIFLKRYSCVFSEVLAVGRISQNKTRNCQHRVEAAGISVLALPDYNNINGFLKSLPSIYRKLNLEVSSSDVVIGRIPGPIGLIAMFIGAMKKKIVVTEVVADPWDAFSRGAVRTPIRPILRIVLTLLQKIVCFFGHGAAYVTSEALQNRYPPGGITANYSSIDLDDSWNLDISEIEKMPRMNKKPSSTWVVTFVGSLSQMYKGPDVLLKAIQICRKKGLNLKCQIVGDGRMRDELKRLSHDLGIADSISFLGKVSRPEVLTILDGSDLYLLPSRQEGLPRSIIEAMSRGLLVISTDIGGIPELLCPEALVRPGDPQALADKVLEFVTNQKSLRRMIKANVIHARDYNCAALQPRRVKFYQAVAALVSKSSGT